MPIILASLFKVEDKGIEPLQARSKLAALPLC